MKTFKLTLEYDGTKYSGWQEQKNARTVMGELRKAAEDLYEAEVDLQGAGRTDAGVHAAAQVCHMRTNTKPAKRAAAVRHELNDRLPSDVVILDVEEVDNNFHARHDATSRSYVYQISTRKTAFSKKYVWWVKEKLDTALMAKAAAMLAGHHNFAAFRAVDPSKPGESPIVVVESCEVEIQDDLVLIRIEASHFLWRMVRRIVGVLVKLGKGDITLENFETLLQGEADPGLNVAGWTAPASGLFLEKINYAAVTASIPKKRK